MTQEQNKQIFELICRKLEAELATVEEDARQRRVAVKEESKLRQELMVKELEARVATAAVATIAPPAKTIVMEDNDIIGEVHQEVMNICEVPQEVMNITSRFAGLPQE